MSKMEIKPLTGTLGAEIIGADVRRDMDWEGIRQAFVDYSVITIRDQNITPEDHLDFAKRWGEINVNRFFTPLDSHPNIAIVLNEPDQTAAVGEDWHTDHSYDTEPAMCSILHAIDMPAYGGDKCFSSMYAAYDALSDDFKKLLAGMKAWHSSRHAFGVSQTDHESYKTGRLQNAELATQDALHPVVLTHPLSGRKALYVNPDFTTRIEGLKKPESDAILFFLYNHCKNADFQCRVSWRKGDVTMWDNRATWHKAINDYQGHRRYMHRVTVEGCALYE
jgi:taurine dioxygenase